MRYFRAPQTLEELKRQYRNLAMENHPDRGGSTETMQAINAEYDRLFQLLKNVHETATGETYTTATNEEDPHLYREIIDRLIRLDGIIVEICGSWLWVTGNTFIHRGQLKALSFRWSNNKKAWYFHAEGYRKMSGKSFSLDDIRNMYGSKVVDCITVQRIG